LIVLSKPLSLPAAISKSSLPQSKAQSTAQSAAETALSASAAGETAEVVRVARIGADKRTGLPLDGRTAADLSGLRQPLIAIGLRTAGNAASQGAATESTRRLRERRAQIRK